MRRMVIAQTLRRLTVALALFALPCFASGCDDGWVFISVNSGFVVSGGACDGTFTMRSDGGLLLLVVVGSGTPIFLPGGGEGTCHDIVEGTRASVRGPTQNDTVTANRIELG